MVTFRPVSDLLDLCTPNATWHLGPCAEVRVGDHVTRYIRRGTGPSVVLVGPDTSANPTWAPLVEHLAPNHRIVVPQLPPADVDVVAWLRGFMEGLGLTGAVVIAGNGSSSAALDLAASDDYLVRKVVVMPDLADEVSMQNSERTLYVYPGGTTTESLERIEAFIAP